MDRDGEERMAHLERQVDDLSGVVAAQGRTIDALERRVAMLLEKVAAADADGGGGGVVLGDERPPHW